MELVHLISRSCNKSLAERTGSLTQLKQELFSSRIQVRDRKSWRDEWPSNGVNISHKKSRQRGGGGEVASLMAFDEGENYRARDSV